jgi:hypothetical protein
VFTTRIGLTRHATTSGVNAYIATHARTHVIILNPDAGVLGRVERGHARK